jgi:putative FmdB family regulatory protein
MMPTYEYRCLKCKKKFEKLQSMKENPIKKCVFCSGRVERLIGAGVGLIFKGSGFYATDYKKREPKEKEQKSKEQKPKEKEPKVESKKELPVKKKE